MTRQEKTPALIGIATATVLSLMLVAPARAEGGGKKVTATGTVSATFDDDWILTSARFTAQDGATYSLTLDKNGKKLADEMEGQDVQVSGTLVERDGAKWLTVHTFKKVDEDEEDGDEDEEEDG